MQNRVPIESSLIATLSYDPATHVLDVEMRTGRVYRYWMVPPSAHEALLGAASAGRYFITEIRDRFPNQELAMNGIEREVDNALREWPASAQSVRKCSDEEGQPIVERAKSKFVEGNPRAWWLSLKNPPCETHMYDTHGFEHLPRYVPEGATECWLIPETDTERMPVYDCAVSAVPEILSRCFLFEYYVVSKDFDWLIINTDHGELVVCR